MIVSPFISKPIVPLKVGSVGYDNIIKPNADTANRYAILLLKTIFRCIHFSFPIEFGKFERKRNTLHNKKRNLCIYTIQ